MLLPTKIITVLTLSLLLVSCGTNKLATAEQMKHEFIVDFPNTSKDALYDKTIRWIAQNFKSAKDVIDVQDRINGTIIAKGIIPQVWFDDYGLRKYSNLSFTLTFDARDNKARLNYTNIDMTDMGEVIHRLHDVEGVHIAAHKEFEKMNEALFNAITNEDKF